MFVFNNLDSFYNVFIFRPMYENELKPIKIKIIKNN